MGAQKPKATRQVSQAVHTVRILLRPQNRGLVLAAIVTVFVLGFWAYAWQRWGKEGLSPSEYRIGPDQVFVTPGPAWIHADVEAEVLRTAGMTELDLRDPQLVEKVASAFALHPWVAEVVQVRKQAPARIDVELRYRRPVAVVEVAARSESGLLFIDAEGVLLPSADFAPGQAKEFLRIAAANETPAGVYGTPWGSQRIAGAARLAAVWEGESKKGNVASSGSKRWQRLKLYRIAAVQAAGGDFIYELQTRTATRIVWGSAPGMESSGEPSPEDKMASLERFVADKGDLDRENVPLIDLRRDATAAAAAGNSASGQRKSNR
jgi:hypothetical protein